MGVSIDNVLIILIWFVVSAINTYLLISNGYMPVVTYSLIASLLFLIIVGKLNKKYGYVFSPNNALDSIIVLCMSMFTGIYIPTLAIISVFVNIYKYIKIK